MMNKPNLVYAISYIKQGIEIKHVNDLKDIDTICFYTNFLDDINDGILVYYDTHRKLFTDDSYVSFQYETHGLKLNDYQKLIRQLSNNTTLQYDKDSDELVMPSSSETYLNDFADYLQDIINAFAILKLKSINQKKH